ncbi:MAG: hypothetical protein K5988_02095 [Lachnospiraceae bacterium]|nr:hypothetical protein [Lachnospiraceae bacterium]
MINNEDEYEVNYCKKAKKGKLLSLVPILVNILGVVSIIAAFVPEGLHKLSFILMVVPGFIFPIIGFVYSVIVRKIYFERSTPLWIIGFIVNIIIFIIYGFGVFMWGFVFLCFSGGKILP